MAFITGSFVALITKHMFSTTDKGNPLNFSHEYLECMKAIVITITIVLSFDAWPYSDRSYCAHTHAHAMHKLGLYLSCSKSLYYTFGNATYWQYYLLLFN